MIRARREDAPPGRLIDIGGFRLHLHCLGAGAPAVVFDSALGGSCLSWIHVQPEVARFARACSYDRAGMGWSDAGPMPRTAATLAAELRALLTRAGVPPPYVLVGHSFGALVMRLYASSYGDEVAGLVLVDPAHPAEWLHLTEDHRRRVETGAWLCRRGATAARLGIATLVSWLARVGALEVARFVVSLVSGGRLEGQETRILAPVDKMPSDLRPALYRMWTRAKFFEALASQIGSVSASAAQVAAAERGYHDLPLVTISAGNAGDARLAEQERLVRLSSRGRHLVARESGHWIPLDQPAVIVDAIRDVVTQARNVRRET